MLDICNSLLYHHHNLWAQRCQNKCQKLKHDHVNKLP
uniref:Uncharacterized protein n=1 Tax=Arundo donax TaxID=35708 RepID=A0A0A8YQS8_ARUDO